MGTKVWIIWFRNDLSDAFDIHFLKIVLSESLLCLRWKEAYCIINQIFFLFRYSLAEIPTKI